MREADLPEFSLDRCRTARLVCHQQAALNTGTLPFPRVGGNPALAIVRAARRPGCTRRRFYGLRPGPGAGMFGTLRRANGGRYRCTRDAVRRCDWEALVG